MLVRYNNETMETSILLSEYDFIELEKAYQMICSAFHNSKTLFGEPHLRNVHILDTELEEMKRGLEIMRLLSNNILLGEGNNE